MKGMISDMHAQDVRVIFWATSMVDDDSSNFNDTIAHKAYIRDAVNDAPTLLKWWHGKGLLLDYFQGASKSWWESQLDSVLSLGLDGWKVDGTDPYIAEYLGPRSWNTSVGKEGGFVSLKEYQDQYYGHFFNYTRAFNGDDGLIWSRPVDSYPIISDHPKADTSTDGLSAYLTFSPKYVMFSGWVGDQDPTFNGLRDAMRNMIHSAWHNYTGFGSDTGGYRTGPGPLGRTGELLLRWAGVNAMMPLFENGGDKEHRPWKFDLPGSTYLTDSYRVLVAQHYELEGYLYTLGHAAYAAGVSAMRPNQAPDADFPFIAQFNVINDYSFRLGDEYFVVPVVHENTSAVRTYFPGAQDMLASPTLHPAARPLLRDAGNAVWVSLHDPTLQVAGGRNATVNCSGVGSIPTFVRANALVPLHVSTPLLGNGDSASASAITWFSHVRVSPAALRAGVLFAGRLATWKAPGTDAHLALETQADGSITAHFTVSAFNRPDKDTILLLRGVQTSPGTRVSAAASNCLRDSCGPTIEMEVPQEQPRVFASTSTNTGTPLHTRGAAGGASMTRHQGDVAVPYIARGMNTEQPLRTVRQQVASNPHWFAAAASHSAAGVDELFVRVGDASAGVRVTITGLHAAE